MQNEKLSAYITDRSIHSTMHAVILLGGKGTRISRLFPGRPKALVPVAGQPFLERQIAWLARGEVTDIHLAAGHLAGAVIDWASDLDIRGQKSAVSLSSKVCATGAGGTAKVLAKQAGQMSANSDNSDKTHEHLFNIKASTICSSPSDISLSCSIEPSPLGTGGGLKYVQQYIRSDPFMVLNGDSLLPHLDFAAFRQNHQKDHPLASLAVTMIRKTGRYGTVEFDEHSRIRVFHEKAERAEGWVNGGVYLLNKKAIELIEPGKAISLETDLFPKLAAQGQLRAFPVPPPLLDMGTPEGLAAMEHYFINSNAKHAGE
jgi:NDP-sugar pyrophosphorylase family protein